VRSSFRIGPGAGVMEAGWQAPARQLQSGGQLRDLSQPRGQTVETLDRGKPPRPALFVDCPHEPREGQLAGNVAHPIPEPGPKPNAVRPREGDGRDANVEVHREGGGDVDEGQPQIFGHRPTRLLDLIDNEGIDAFIADRGRRVPQDHLRLHHDSANPAAQRGESFELAAFLVARAERAEGEVVLADLAEPQPSGPDGRLQVGHLEVDHVVPSRLQSPDQRGQRIEVGRRGETQDAYSTIHDDSSLLDCSVENDAYDGFRLTSRSVHSLQLSLLPANGLSKAPERDSPGLPVTSPARPAPRS